MQLAYVPASIKAENVCLKLLNKDLCVFFYKSQLQLWPTEVAQHKHCIKCNLKLKNPFKSHLIFILVSNMSRNLQYSYIHLVTLCIKLAVCSCAAAQRLAVREFNSKSQLIGSETLFSKYRSLGQPTKCKNLSKTDLLSCLTVEIRQSMSHTSTGACMNLIPLIGTKQ